MAVYERCNYTALASLYDDENATIKNSLEIVQFYYTPLLVAFGSIGNWLSIIVFFSTKLRNLSSSLYLAALAISDTGFLLTLFIVWLNFLDVPLFNQRIICELCIYSSNVCSFLSVWFVVAFTVERFIAVGYPLKRPSMCTVRRAKIVLICLTICSLIINAPYLLMAGPQEQFDEFNNCTVSICGLDERYNHLASVLNTIDFVVTLILPFFAISLLNSCISLTVWKLARVRKSMTNRQQHRTMIRNTNNCVTVRSTSSQTKVTKMLLVVSTVFICLNLPSYVLRVWVYVRGMVKEEDKSQHASILILQHAFMMMFHTNFGINFVLYCVSGQNFRKALMSLFCAKQLRRIDTSRVTVVSEFGRSFSNRRRTTTTTNGSVRHGPEMLPLTKFS